ncbi:hypothetical protein PROFUN_00918 [Planoprotostelium fungivorum]|uniref:Mini-chromosome maintenance complex-binding protein n=1 Tax=Planoprotostelium fungivorum TaxID=1890364 RepID=A0A2P6P0C7_9EUKA|nr:hypothetical protein PROFUN_00918 [Planoprotostelium fungivorum]
MVMEMTNEWINQPLQITQKLFEKSHSSSTISSADDPWNVKKSFEEAFGDNWTQIPLLSQASSGKLSNGSLVRVRAMIQDTFDPEFFLESVYASNDQGHKCLCTSKYRDGLDVQDDYELDETSQKFGERYPLLCVSPPGLNSWADENVTPPTPITTGNKRRAPEEPSDMEDSIDLQRPRVQEHSENILAGNSDPSVYPIQKGKASLSPPCLVRVYDASSDSFKLNHTFEFVGILHYSGPQEEAQMDVDDFETVIPGQSAMPRLECIQYRRVDDRRLVEGSNAQMEVEQVRETRRLIIDWLASTLHGDKLAAEYVLLNLLSKIHHRAEALPLGSLSLNVKYAPQSTFTAAPLSHVISQIVTRDVLLNLTVEHLNETTFVPKKDIDTNRLHAGVLQVSEGTIMVIDEGKLRAGQLTAHGTSNVTALGNMMTWQRVEYDFQYQRIPFPVDVPAITLSHGNSLIKAMISVSVREEETPTVSPTPDQLHMMRRYIAHCRYLNMDIDEATSAVMQNTFVHARKTDSEVRQDTLHLWLTLARLQCKSFGESQLSEERWNYTLDVEKRRVARS